MALIHKAHNISIGCGTICDLYDNIVNGADSSGSFSYTDGGFSYTHVTNEVTCQRCIDLMNGANILYPSTFLKPEIGYWRE